MYIGYGEKESMDDDLLELFENGFCNSEASHVACKEGYKLCMECFCSNNSVITSPNFPEKYPKLVDMKWLIKYPPGERIKIKVHSFSVDGILW